MKSTYEIRGTDPTYEMKVWNDEGVLLRQSEKVLTAPQVARVLRKSQRHIYRYIQSGALHPLGKFLGGWLFDGDEVTRFHKMTRHFRLPLKKMTIPSSFQIYFPEYSLDQMNPWTNAPIFLTRVLDSGTRKEWGWVFNNIPKTLIRVVVQRHGKRLMSPRSYYFWKWMLKIA